MNDHDDGYEGPATLVVGDERFAVTARLGGHFQPLDGHYRWYGRLEADEDVLRAVGERQQRVRLYTAEGQAEGRITERDLWNRYRIEGTSVPPFHIPYALEEVAGDG